MLKNHLPGIIVACIILIAGPWYLNYTDSEIIEDIPHSDLLLVHGNTNKRYKNPIWNEHHWQAIEQYKKGNFQAAINTMQYIIDQTQSEPVAYYTLGTLHTYQKQWEEAEKNYHLALELDPRYAQAYAGLANIAAHHDQHYESIKLYKKSFSYMPNSIIAHFRIAKEYEWVQKYQPALSHYKKVILLDTDSRFSDKARERVKVLEDYFSTIEKHK